MCVSVCVCVCVKSLWDAGVKVTQLDIPRTSAATQFPENSSIAPS